MYKVLNGEIFMLSKENWPEKYPISQLITCQTDIEKLLRVKNNDKT